MSGSVRATWLWLRAQQLRWPLQQAVYLHGKPGEITWVEPTYHAVHTTLTHPAYAGAYGGSVPSAPSAGIAPIRPLHPWPERGPGTCHGRFPRSLLTI